MYEWRQSDAMSPAMGACGRSESIYEAAEPSRLLACAYNGLASAVDQFSGTYCTLGNNLGCAGGNADCVVDCLVRRTGGNSDPSRDQSCNGHFSNGEDFRFCLLFPTKGGHLKWRRFRGHCVGSLPPSRFPAAHQLFQPASTEVNRGFHEDRETNKKYAYL